MLWLSIGLATMISMVALAYVLWPILRRAPAPVLIGDDRLTELLARKDAVLASIKELEFDYYVGKVSKEDFERFNKRLRHQAIVLLQQIEKVAPEIAGLNDRMEREVVRLRKTKDRRSESSTDGIVPASTKPFKPVVRPNQETMSTKGSARSCTNCGNPLDSAYKFCGHCGLPIAAVVTASPPEP
jgi:hypothetical protein